jgi:putative DNA primase/helicase
MVGIPIMDANIQSIIEIPQAFTLTEHLRQFLASEHEVTEIQIADAAAMFLGNVNNLTVFTEGKLWQFSSDIGVFRPIDDAEIKNNIYDLNGAMTIGGRYTLRPHQANNIVRVLKDRLNEPGYFHEAQDGLALPNGFLTVVDGSLELQPLSSEFRQRGYVPVPYKADADTAPIDAFLLDTLEDEELVNLVYEITGVALMGHGAVYQTIVVFHGEGANGKGVVTKLIQKFFPLDMRSSISPGEWKNDYQRYRLYQSRFNAVGELPRLDSDTVNWMKSICAGDTIMARPVRGNQFEFTPSALHLFSTNNLPSMSEHGEAIKRRFLVVPFNKIIPEEDRDYRLADRLFDECKTGLLRRAVEGYERVLKREDIARPLAARLAATRWLDRSCPVKVFAKECLIKTDDPTDRIATKEMFDGCAAFCKENQLPLPSSTKAFSPELEAHGYQKTKSGTMQWVGVRWLD